MYKTELKKSEMLDKIVEWFMRNNQKIEEGNWSEREIGAYQVMIELMTELKIYDKEEK